MGQGQRRSLYLCCENHRCARSAKVDLPALAFALVVAEIELRKVAVQVLRADVVIGADQPALEDGEIVLHRSCARSRRRTYSSAEWLTVP
jgi:hypothetical protein